MTRVLVCGGRDYGKKDGEGQRLIAVLDEVDRERSIDTLIHGGAFGADLLGATWAVVRNQEYSHPPVKISVFIAEWERHGKAAGPIRNQRMIDEGKPDLVVAFPGGSGTADMVKRARAAGIEVMEVE